MQKTTFRIAKMDCPSEEQMIKMKLSDLTNIRVLDFDIPNRKLIVVHSDHHTSIFQRLDDLKFDTSIIESITIEEDNIVTNAPENEAILLWKVLGINFFFFVLELITGFISNSLGLIADSLDMLADSIVYGLALIAVGSTRTHKKNIAKAAGYLQLVLACIGFIEVIRRFVGLHETPVFQTMMIISVLALIGNAICLYLLQKSKSEEAHIKASTIFTSNDVIVNLGVILAGVLVYWTKSQYPDLIIGTIVFIIVGRGSIKILKLSKSQ
jgi:Co/Zn/Cd efflux system component